MKSNFLLLLSFSIFCSCTPKLIPPSERVDIQCYYSSIRLKNNNISAIHYTEIKEEGDAYIKIGRIYDKTTDKKIKRTQEPFAIVYWDDVYINMLYSDAYRNQGTYVIFDEVGKVCALYIRKGADGQVKKGGNSYSLGLVGVLERGINKIGRNWRDENGDNNKILIINPGKPDVEYNAHSKLLSRNNFNKKLNTNYSKNEIFNFTFEDVVAIIKEINEN